MGNPITKRTQKLKEKTCAFPGCKTIFIGKGKAKYCEEHRKPKYRKELYKQNDNDGDGIVTLEHDETCSTDIVRTCGCDGCDNEYVITLTPRLFEYPNYCPEHRNAYKREVFLKEQEDDS